MRLIDADSFKKFLTKLYEAGAPYDGIIELLDKQPTAYDVDKVVEELGKKQNNKGFGGTIQEIFYDLGLEDAIEIVKGGEVNE
jgi:hypothetical protein